MACRLLRVRDHCLVGLQDAELFELLTNAEFAHQLLARRYSEAICGYRSVGVECRAS
jgi:hypothetical protein